MRVCEHVRRMSAAKLAKALRCPYEWHKPIIGEKPSCGEKDCDKCIELFDFGDTSKKITLREMARTMTASQLANALKCPFDWFKPLENARATCDWGMDCTKCILEFLLERDANEFDKD